MHEINYYMTLKRTIFSIVVVTALIPIVVIASIAGYQFHTAYKTKVLAYLSELVQKHAQNIDVFLRNNIAVVRTISHTISLNELNNPDRLSEVLRLLQEAHEGVFVDFGLIRGDGIQVSYAGPFKLGMANYAESPWFSESKERPYYISDVFLGLRGLPHFIVAVKTSKGDEEWIFRSTIDFATFNRIVENIQIGQTGKAFIINKKGALQTFSVSDPSLSKELLLGIAKEALEGHDEKDSPMAHTEGLFFESLPITIPDSEVEAAGSKVKVFRKTDPNGVEMLYLSMPINNGNWILVYRQAEAEAFKSLYQARSLVVGIIILASMILAVLGYWLANKIVARIKDVDREKDAMNEQIIQAGKLASLGELSAGIAHEINNPVAIMVEEAGWIEDCLSEFPEKESDFYKEVSNSIKQIKTQGSRCKEITHKLLTFARRTDSGAKELHLNVLISEIMILCEQRARYAKVKLEKKLTSNLPPVPISPTEMQQVVLNLVNNAIDAMEPLGGGTLKLVTGKTDDWVLLEVTDTGPGIPKSILPRIFEPFFTTKPVGKGTGLGLSICYGIIKKSGGDIEVNSVVGSGTTFKVWLPGAKKAVDTSPSAGTLDYGSSRSDDTNAPQSAKSR